MKRILLLIAITTAYPALARDTAPTMPIKAGIWVHSAIDKNGRVDTKGDIAICETFTDLWRDIQQGEQGEGCGKTHIAMPGDQITTDQDCEDDMGNSRTSITHTHAVYVPIRAGAGPVTAYKVINTFTTKNHAGKITAQNQETSLHQWLQPCARSDAGKIYDRTRKQFN
ncbi:MAG: hypothetical protein HOP20_10720 [Sulfuriferula sp.]|nr:hypothetical protein [Sulfuriferula sp.]